MKTNALSLRLIERLFVGSKAELQKSIAAIAKNKVELLQVERFAAENRLQFILDQVTKLKLRQ